MPIRASQDTESRTLTTPSDIPDDVRLSVREWPAAERPRERLRDLGAAHLSTAELLAIILRTGTRENSVVALAQGLLDKYGGAGGLAQASFRQITQFPGVGEAKVAQLKAALELGRRASASAQPAQPVIRSATDAKNYLLSDFVDEEQEKFLVVLLDTKHHVVGKETLYRGTLNQTAVRPAEVFREAVRANCAAVLVAHNHPSGDPTPSADDVATTARLEKIGDLLEIELCRSHYHDSRQRTITTGKRTRILPQEPATDTNMIRLGMPVCAAIETRHLIGQVAQDVQDSRIPVGPCARHRGLCTVICYKQCVAQSLGGDHHEIVC